MILQPKHRHMIKHQQEAGLPNKDTASAGSGGKVRRAAACGAV
jgi:hypothetical protein